MSTITKRILFWTPRVLCILFALFLSLFALDVFSEGYGFGEAVLALLIHLVPTYLVVIALAIAWRREGVGAILFIALTVFYLVVSRGEGWVIAAPLLLIGVLFLLNWIFRAQLEAR
jgi:hypothetical protein